MVATTSSIPAFGVQATSRRCSNWTAIGVNWLAGFDFEIKVIARIPDETARRNRPVD
jgi:uncharacterized protein involved in copper resistance